MVGKRRKPSEIIAQIHSLLDELATLSGGRVAVQEKRVEEKSEKFTGPSGGIKLLLKEGFFAEPKTLTEVVSRLHQDGFKYVTQVISTALVRLVRARMLVRLPSTGPGKEQWVYTERK